MIDYKAKLNYTVKETHPDFEYLNDPNWTPEKIYEDKDGYHIDPEHYYDEDDIVDYIKEDMLLIAGGGYNWNGIDNIRFEIINMETGELFE